MEKEPVDETLRIGSILGVWAHPDDEVYLSGGLMADAIRSGRRATVVMATAGQSGTSDPESWPPEKLGPLRKREMAAAMSALGVSDLRWLGYVDGMCSTVPEEEAVGRLAEIMAEVAPDTVLTFGPDGMTGHDDHRAVCLWATEAFHRAAPGGSRLLYAAAPSSHFERWKEMFHSYNVFYPGYPQLFSEEDLVVAYQVPEELLPLKKQAIRAHASQVDGFIEEVGEEAFMSINSIEWFRLGAEQLPKS